jgi:hypothetical protein
MVNNIEENFGSDNFPTPEYDPKSAVVRWPVDQDSLHTPRKTTLLQPRLHDVTRTGSILEA